MMYGHVVDFLQLHWQAVVVISPHLMLQAVRLPLVVCFNVARKCGDKEQEEAKMNLVKKVVE